VLEAEAARICELVLAGGFSPLLNIGSSTEAFRSVERPHIEQNLFAPLRRRGFIVDHLDLKAGRGVDIQGNILDEALRQQLRQRGYRGILLSNVLEHVGDRAAIAAACEDIVGPGGAILASAPASFPYHADPLDSLFRPTPEQIASLFRRSEVRVAETLTGPSYAEQMAATGRTALGEAARTLLWLLLAPVRPRSCLARLHRWFWYRRPYRVSIALLAVR
jgi:hypothetical protein